MGRFKTQFWGVRGSLPAPKTPQMVREFLAAHLTEFAKSQQSVESYLQSLLPWQSGGFGGDTSCVEVEAGATQIIIDAGSGLRRLGERMMRGPCGQGRGEVHLFFTHFHWDHVIGLPFFTPIFIPGNTIHFYAVQPELEACVRQVFCKPLFPVPFAALPSKIHFHRLEPRRPFTHGAMQITPYQLDHPDPCWGYRIEAETVKGRRSYAHSVDNEATRVTPADLGEDVKLYRGADLCYFDAQYTLQEFLKHVSWGHATAPVGIEIGLREGVKAIVFAHHDPAASDQKIAEAERQTREFLSAYRLSAKAAGRHLPEISWGFANDGDVFDLGEVRSEP